MIALAWVVTLSVYMMTNFDAAIRQGIEDSSLNRRKPDGSTEDVPYPCVCQTINHL